jgi:hypothetical protein
MGGAGRRAPQGITPIGPVLFLVQLFMASAIAVLKKVRYALCPMPYALCPMPMITSSL